ncbi:hypothetical protein GCM10025771_20190 [Niveibacterium umoris]|uniref:Uncharacterized protein n=1 Tax=Niveibacterium umoris TaxID=1193620 RepID=A0A840BGW1_9RHOO|nr:hypothetical protein [Niveibacterium umoris]MBB4012791.1 hypothetical protein [Niveibacterium umoris]
MASLKECAIWIAEVFWAVLPFILVNELRATKMKNDILLCALAWTERNEMLVVDICDAKFSVSRSYSSIEFLAKDLSGREFEISLYKKSSVSVFPSPFDLSKIEVSRRPRVKPA